MVAEDLAQRHPPLALIRLEPIVGNGLPGQLIQRINSASCGSRNLSVKGAPDFRRAFARKAVADHGQTAPGDEADRPQDVSCPQSVESLGRIRGVGQRVIAGHDQMKPERDIL